MGRFRAGAICGNPLEGMCRRECIQVTKVYDGCISRIADQPITTTITSQGQAPYVFISEESVGQTSISNLLITPTNNNNQSTVSFDATVPVTVSYIDSLNNTYVTTSTYTMHRDVVLKIPHQSISPYTIEVETILKSTSGAFINLNDINCRVCIIQVCKVCCKVDILVPSYGYAVFPNCSENGPCDGLNNLPLFPPLI